MEAYGEEWPHVADVKESLEAAFVVYDVRPEVTVS